MKDDISRVAFLGWGYINNDRNGYGNGSLALRVGYGVGAGRLSPCEGGVGGGGWGTADTCHNTNRATVTELGRILQDKKEQSSEINFLLGAGNVFHAFLSMN